MNKTFTYYEARYSPATNPRDIRPLCYSCSSNVVRNTSYRKVREDALEFDKHNIADFYNKSIFIVEITTEFDETTGQVYVTEIIQEYIRKIMV